MTPLTLQQIQSLMDSSPLIRFLGIRVTQIDPNDQTAEFSMPMRAEIERLPGSEQYHGGALASFIDTAGDFAAGMLVGGALPTIDMRVDYLRPAAGAELRALAIVRRLGASRAVVDIDVVDTNDILVAIGRAAYAVPSRSQAETRSLESNPEASAGGGTESLPKVSVLQQRRIEAGIIKPIYEVLLVQLGVERAQQLLGEAIRRTAIASGRQWAEQTDGGTNLETFEQLFEMWTAEDALRMEVISRTADAFDFDITRCRYAEMYQEVGLAEVGHLLSCQRDGVFCQGYDPNITLSRTQTIMQGAPRCNFRFRYQKLPGKP